MYSDSRSSVLSAENVFSMIPKMFVQSGLHCSLRENKRSLGSAHIVGECNTVGFEPNRVQDTLAALHVHKPALENPGMN